MFHHVARLRHLYCERLKSEICEPNYYPTRSLQRNSVASPPTLYVRNSELISNSWYASLPFTLPSLQWGHGCCTVPLLS